MPDRAAIIAPPPMLTAVCIGAGMIGDHFKPFPLIRDLGFVPRVAICISVLFVAAMNLPMHLTRGRSLARG